MRLEFWKHWVFDDPAWDWRTFDYDRDVAYADAKMAAVNAINTYLSVFRSRGGKLLMYSGWADPIGPPADAIDYYKHVKEATGGQQKTESFFRLFMVPGMAHCRGGPGANFFGGYDPLTPVPPDIKIDPQHDMLSALVQWVETGSAPEYMIASHVRDGHVDRTRPLCRYPKIARWSGSGSSDDAKNFSCVEPASPSQNRSTKK